MGGSTALLIVGVPLALLAVVLWALHYWASERQKVWGGVASALGLSFTPSLGTPVLTGTYRGRALRFDQVSHQGNTVQTRVVVALLRRAGGTLSLSPQAAPINKAARFMGGHGVELGEPAFDARFMIKSEPQAFAVSVLADSELRRKLLAEPAPFLVELDGQTVRFLIGDCCETGVDHMRHVVVDRERVRALLDLASDFATALDACGEASLTPAATSPDLARIARKTTASYAGAALSVLLAVFLSYVAIAQWSAARHFRSVDGTIVRSEVAPGNRPEVTYRYTVAGSTYESPVYPDLRGGVDIEQVQSMIRRHPIGARMTVYYDATMPSRGVLDRPKSPPLALFLAFSWVMCGALLFFCLRGV